MSTLLCGSKTLDLSRAHVMGILNVTPDSFSDGGRFFSAESVVVDRVVSQAAEMVAAGATLLDVGGESTRPGAEPVSKQQEMDRVLPVVERLVNEFDVVVSVDTSTPSLMSNAVSLGAGLVNDVRALTREGALEAVAASQVAVCLMHMQGSPESMQDNPDYRDVCEEVLQFLQQRVNSCIEAGIEPKRICLDPGYGFGKTLEHNLKLLNRLERMDMNGLPWLVGTSRKSMIGKVLNKEADQRLSGSLATVAIAVMKGAKIIRVHDVAETVDVVRMTEAVLNEKESVSV